MAATTNAPVTLDTPIVIKVLFRGQTRRLKLPLKDLGANVLPEKVRECPSELLAGVRRPPVRLVAAQACRKPGMQPLLY